LVLTPSRSAVRGFGGSRFGRRDSRLRIQDSVLDQGLGTPD
jgi:hypothetical protein